MPWAGFSLGRRRPANLERPIVVVLGLNLLLLLLLLLLHHGPRSALSGWRARTRGSSANRSLPSAAMSLPEAWITLTSRSAASSFTSARSPLGSLLGVPGSRPPRRSPFFDPPLAIGYFFNPTFDFFSKTPEKNGYFLPASASATLAQLPAIARSPLPDCRYRPSCRL